MARTAFHTQARALLALGRAAEARQIVDQLNDRFPDLPSLPINRSLDADIAAGLGEWEAAYRAAQAQAEIERSDARLRLSEASERARARLDFETARLQRRELEAQLRTREIEIDSARRQAFWQRIAIGLALGLLTLLALVLLRLRRQGRQLSDLALHDSLTGLPNRRAFFQSARRILQADQASGQPVALLMIDLDHFKTVNDRHGHDVGDRVLQEFSDLLRGVSRTSDLPARIGGEEFGVLLPGTDADGAMQVAQRLLRALNESAPYGQGKLASMSASIGVASQRPGGSLENLMKRADEALYRAKDQGRARAVCAD
jgi:diguanylate cyclase (GGDEF)-like protein